MFDNKTEELTDAKGREVLDRITNRGYMADRVRKKCIKDFGDDVEKWKKKMHVWCNDPDFLAELCQEWSTKSWQDL
jgi:hypothetical protein